MYVCKACNRAINESAKFCPLCGSPQDAEIYGIRDLTTQSRPSGVFGKISIFLLVLCIVFLLVQSILLEAFGVNTEAVVYRAEQRRDTNTDERRDPTRFELGYRYAVAGKTYEGTDTMYFQYGYVTQMGADGKSIPKKAVVRYLPSIPRWSRIVSMPGGTRGSHLAENPFGWGGYALLAVILAALVIRARLMRKKMKSER